MLLSTRSILLQPLRHRLQSTPRLLLQCTRPLATHTSLHPTHSHPIIPISPPQAPTKLHPEIFDSQKGIDHTNTFHIHSHNTWSPRSRRVGVIGIKKGMTQIWDEWGCLVPVTVVQLKQVQVIRGRFNPGCGKWMCEVGAVNILDRKISRPQRGHFRRYVMTPKRKVVEFRVTKDAIPPPGTELTAQHFVPGQFIDVTSKSIGKGTSGVMKKWGFKGQPASHGVSLMHRSGGSIGCSTTPGKVWKGKKMAGRMGGYQVTRQNSQIVKIDTRLNVLYIKGPIPGHDEQFLIIKDSIKKQNMNQLFPASVSLNSVPFPTAFPKSGELVERELVMANERRRDPFVKGKD